MKQTNNTPQQIFDGRSWIKHPYTAPKMPLEPTNTDIIVEDITYEHTYEKDGTQIIKPIVKKTNISASIRESAKLLKINHAQEMQEQLQSYFTIEEEKGDK